MIFCAIVIVASFLFPKKSSFCRNVRHGVVFQKLLFFTFIKAQNFICFLFRNFEAGDLPLGNRYLKWSLTLE